MSAPSIDAVSGLRARIGEVFDGELHLSEEEATRLFDALEAQARELVEERERADRLLERCNSLALANQHEEEDAARIAALEDAVRPFALVADTDCKLIRYSATGWNEADMTDECRRARTALSNGEPK